MHGGKSLRGITSRTFLHGRYSRDGLGRLMWHYSDEAVAERRRIYKQYKEDLLAMVRADREAHEARRAARRRPWVLSEEVMTAISQEVACSDEAVWSGEFLVSFADAGDTEGGEA